MSFRSKARGLLPSSQAVRALKLLAALLAVGAFLFVFAGQARALQEHEWHFDGTYLGLAALMALGRGVFIVYPWWRIIRAWGYGLPWNRALRLYFHSGFARYIPGQWWFVAGRAYLAERQGVPPAATVAATALETVILTGTALLTGLAGLATIPSGGVLAWTWMLALGGVVTLLLPVSPALLARLTDWLLHVMGREKLPAGLSIKEMIRVLAACFANWVMYGLVAALLLAGLSGGGYLAQAPATIGIFALSVLGGAILLFMPQGIIVREGVLVYLLHTLLGVPVPVGLGVAALTRLFSMGAEGVWALAALRI
ncbi:MAG TPA: lysylphosphatidylglycerol synthase domain-containing protein [Chloroflexia bacterium]|nr:lysylphosphatidylglycerol synthase domain-containing protein [Chloroflexia bacterium]